MSRSTIFLTLMLIIYPFNALANQPSEIEWSKTFGGDGAEIGKTVQQTNDGGYIIVGYTESYGNGSRGSWILDCIPWIGSSPECYHVYKRGSTDIWLIKTDSQGFLEWDKTFGGADLDYGNSVQETSDGGHILTGETCSYGAGKGDVWLIKTDSQGNPVWDKTFGGADLDYGNSVQETSDGGHILTGETCSYGAGEGDVWLIKTDSQGNPVWDKTFGGSDLDYGNSVQETSDNGYIITGQTWSYGAGGGDVWLIKTDTQGNLEWDKTFGGSGTDEGNSVQEIDDGGYIITGQMRLCGTDKGDVWLIKTDSQGNLEWDKTFGGSGFDMGNSIQKTQDGGYIIACVNDDNIWLIKTNYVGDKEWEKIINISDSGSRGNFVQETNDCSYIVVGNSYEDEERYDLPNIWLIKLKTPNIFQKVSITIEVLNDGHEVVEGDWPKVLVTTSVKGTPVTLTASGGDFTDTGTDTITGVTNNASAFSTLWKAPLAAGEYTISAEVSKPGYESSTATVNVTVHPDYRFIVEPRSALQGTETELRVTANLPALEESGEEAVKMGDPVHWYITTPSGQEIEGEKDTFHESRAGGPSNVATYDFPEAGEYVVKVELSESGLERAWIVNVSPLIREYSGPELSGKELAEAKAEEILGSIDRENTTGVQFYEHPTAGSNGYWVVFQEGGHNIGGKNIAVVMESITGNIIKDETILLPVFYTVEVKEANPNALIDGNKLETESREMISDSEALQQASGAIDVVLSILSKMATSLIDVGGSGLIRLGAGIVVDTAINEAFGVLMQKVADTDRVNMISNIYRGVGYLTSYCAYDLKSLDSSNVTYHSAYNIHSIYHTSKNNFGRAMLWNLEQNDDVLAGLQSYYELENEYANNDALMWGYAAKDMTTSLQTIGAISDIQ